MKANIVLRCEGRTDDGFQFCSGTSNLIVNLEEIRHKENYKNFIQYLDRVPKIFEGPCCNQNIITNTLFKAYEFGFISEKKYKQLAHFYKFHTYCGMILEVKAK